MSTVVDGKVVVFHYTMAAGGKKIEDTRTGAGQPMAYLHGRGQLLPGLEGAIAGRAAGDRFEVTVPAKDGFGEKRGQGPQAVPKKEFPKNTSFVVGMPLQLRDGAGNPVRVWITRVEGAKVWIDLDHPMAGQELVFEVEVLGIRDPLPEELEHGHAHGADGHGGHA